MHIGINGYEAAVPRFGFDKKTGLPNRVGSSEFCYQLLSSLYSLDKKNRYTIFLPVNPSADLPKESKTWRYAVLAAKKLWTLFALGKKLREYRGKMDVFFSPTHYLPLKVPCPSVISILDVSYIYFPALFKKRDFYQLKVWGKYSIKKADRIITISYSSKNDIIKAYGVNEAKITVVYPGIKQLSKANFMKKEELKKKFKIEKDYLLFVGTLQPRKNIIRLIEAFSLLKKDDLQLIIIGKPGWQFEEIRSSPQKFGVADKVIFLENITNAELPSFYRYALCFVLPSLYEGFGLPILEAMQYGCPVVTSSVSSLPEAAGEAAVYVNPEDVQDIAEKLKKVVSEPKLREELIKKGYNQVKKFSWEKTAGETLRVLEEVGNSS